MAADAEFANLVRFFEEIDDCMDKAMIDHASSEKLIASAEYELGEVRKTLAVPTALATAAEERGAPRRAPFRRDEKWWAVLGLNQ